MLKKSTAGIKEKNGVIHDENQYLHLISDIINEGEMITGRNGLAKTIFGSAMHFSLENNTLPLLTTKKVAWKTCLRELLWFIKGSTSNKVSFIEILSVSCDCLKPCKLYIISMKIFSRLIRFFIF